MELRKVTLRQLHHAPHIFWKSVFIWLFYLKVVRQWWTGLECFDVGLFCEALVGCRTLPDIGGVEDENWFRKSKISFRIKYGGLGLGSINMLFERTFRKCLCSTHFSIFGYVLFFEREFHGYYWFEGTKQFLGVSSEEEQKVGLD